MKKTLSMLGSITVAAMPIATTISCGKEKTTDNDGTNYMYGDIFVDENHVYVEKFEQPYPKDGQTFADIEAIKIEFFNELGNRLVDAIEGKNITELTVNGFTVSRDFEWEQAHNSIEFSQVLSSDNLGEYMKDLEEEDRDGLNQGAQTILKAIDGLIEDRPPEGITIDESAEILKNYLEVQFIETTRSSGGFEDSVVRDSSDAESKLGITEEDFDGLVYLVGYVVNGFKFRSAVTYQGVDEIMFNFNHITTNDSYSAIFSRKVSFDGQPSIVELEKANEMETTIKSLMLESTLNSTDDLSSLMAADETEALSEFGLDATEYAKIKDNLVDGWIFNSLTQNEGELGTIVVEYKFGYTNRYFKTIIPDDNITWANE